MTPTLLDRPDIREARAVIHASDDRTLAEQVLLSEVPAPSLDEHERGAMMAELLKRVTGRTPVIDAVGNVIVSAGEGVDSASGQRPFVVSAHLDTVFPRDTDLTVRQEGNVYRGPGISDDARGLATLLCVARALTEASIRTRAPLLFVATVGEEGIGDLRGVKHLFAEGGPARHAVGFISLDGAGIDRVVTKGLASRRFRLDCRGPGGHSWVDWGTPNPIHRLADVSQRLTSIALPREPKTTLTIARVGGGRSINAIPQEAWIEIDARSEARAALAGLEAKVRAVIGSCAGNGLDVELSVIGDRPGGETPEDTALVKAAVEATRAVGHEARLVRSSTDANIPMSIGIPSVTLGCGGEAGDVHTSREWYCNVHGPEGIERALYTIVLAAGLAA